MFGWPKRASFLGGARAGRRSARRPDDEMAPDTPHKRRSGAQRAPARSRSLGATPLGLALAIGIALGIGLLTFMVRLVYPVGRVLCPFGFQLAHFPQYIAWFIAGARTSGAGDARHRVVSRSSASPPSRLQLPRPGSGPPPLADLVPAAGNPFAGPTDVARLVVAWGLRNPYRFTLDPVTGDDLARRIGAGFRAALVDEFQDTDTAQWEIFRALFGERTLYLVGDPKQSIYGFRGAEPGLLAGARELFAVRAGEDAVLRILDKRRVGFVEHLAEVQAASDGRLAGPQRGRHRRRNHRYRGVSRAVGRVQHSPFHKVEAERGEVVRSDGVVVGPTARKARQRIEALEAQPVPALVELDVFGAFQEEELGSLAVGKRADVTVLDRDAPELESIASFCPAAEWIEREIWELLGGEFIDHPDLRHLLLSDDWPEGNYPLRKDCRRRVSSDRADERAAVAAAAPLTGGIQP